MELTTKGSIELEVLLAPSSAPRPVAGGVNNTALSMECSAARRRPSRDPSLLLTAKLNHQVPDFWPNTPNDLDPGRPRRLRALHRSGLGRRGRGRQALDRRSRAARLAARAHRDRDRALTGVERAPASRATNSSS